MWELARVAFRNVGRNRRRSLITIITVFLGVSVLGGTRGLLNGLQGEIRSSLTRKLHGDLQIHVRGYQDTVDSNPFKILIPEVSRLTQQISPIAQLESIAPRLRVFALLNHQKSQSTTPVSLLGIDVPKELAVCPRLAQALQKGALIDSAKESDGENKTEEPLEEAPGLDAPTPPRIPSPQRNSNHQILITPALMRGLGAQIGDELVILLQDKNNMQQAIVTRLVGVVDYAMPTAQAKLAWVDFSTLSKVSGVTDQATELVIRARPEADLETLKKTLASAISDTLVIETWLELGGFFRDAMNLQDIVFAMVLIIVFSIVVSAIINTSLMTVMERTREIGTLMALGYRRAHIVFLFLVEFAVIGMAGGLSGLFVTVIGVGILGKQGLRFRLPGQEIGTILFPEVTFTFLLLVFVLAVCAGLLAGVVPAYRASRMRPVDALRAN